MIKHGTNTTLRHRNSLFSHSLTFFIDSSRFLTEKQTNSLVRPYISSSKQNSLQVR